MGIFKSLLYSFKLKTGLCLGLVGVADFLFYDQDGIGWIAGAFGALVMVASLLMNRRALSSWGGIIIAVLTFGQCLVLVNDPGWLAVALYTFGMVSLMLLSRGLEFKDGLNWLFRVCGFVLGSPKIPFQDQRKLSRACARRRKPGRVQHYFRAWTLPLGLGLVFLILFTGANPVLDQWLGDIDWFKPFEAMHWGRIFFWAFVVVLCWPLLRPKLKISKPKKLKARHSPTLIDWLFSKDAIIRSLVLFNIMFVAQSLMDGAFLWGGVDLPEGMSHAQYAHQGAYPLVGTALLAAAFVLIALRRGGEGEHSALIRGLVYTWVAQNVFLVISSILRTNLYVQEYSLTYLRLSAFIWMGLVATGLMLIVLRMILKRDNVWLINMNILTLMSVLYFCSFSNLGGFIAQYNVEHCKEAGGSGERIDLYYLQREIGIASLPAHEWLSTHSDTFAIGGSIDWLIIETQEQQKNWRTWTLLNYRILEYIKSNTPPQPEVHVNG